MTPSVSEPISQPMIETEAVVQLLRSENSEQVQGFTTIMVIGVFAVGGLMITPLIISMVYSVRRGQTIQLGQLYRVLVAVGVIFIVILIVIYLNSLVWFNIGTGIPEAIMSDLLETQKNFLTIIGTAFASLVAFYFGARSQRDDIELKRSGKRPEPSEDKRPEPDDVKKS